MVAMSHKEMCFHNHGGQIMTNADYPNRVNTKGFPTLLGVPTLETIGAVETLVITFQPHKELNANWSGAFFVEIASPIVTGAQPVVFRTQGVTGYVPLMLFNGVQATSASLTTTTGGVVMCFYNRDENKLQLMATNV